MKFTSPACHQGCPRSWTPLHPSTSCALHLAKRGANRHPPFILPVSTQSVTFCCTYRFPIFRQKNQSTFCPRPARTTPPHARALLLGEVASFSPPKNPRRYEPEWPIISSPISAQTTTALQFPFCPQPPGMSREIFKSAWGCATSAIYPFLGV